MALNTTFNDYGALPPENINEPHQHVVFVCDKSLSMSGKPIDSLNRSLNRFAQDVCEDKVAARVVETAIVAFDDNAQVVQDWRPITEMNPVNLVAGGCTNITKGLESAIEMCRARTRLIPVDCHKPAIVLITDGYGGDVTQIAEVVQQRIADRKMQMWILCVKGYDEATVAALCERDSKGNPKFVMELKDEEGYDFSQFFNMLSKSIKAVSVSTPGTQVHVDLNAEDVDNLKVPNLDAWLND